MLKKLVSIMLSAVLLVIGCIPASAAEYPEETLNLPDGMELLSVEVVPNSIADADLPDNLASAIASFDETSTYGLSKPDKNNVWNLTTDGAYNFTAESYTQDVYSNYVFTGHNGRVKFRICDSSGEAGYALLQLRVRNFWNTKIYSVGILRGIVEITEYQWDTLIGPDELIYFIVCPGGVYTNITVGTMSTF